MLSKPVISGHFNSDRKTALLKCGLPLELALRPTSQREMPSQERKETNDAKLLQLDRSDVGWGPKGWAFCPGRVPGQYLHTAPAQQQD